MAEENKVQQVTKEATLSSKMVNSIEELIRR